MNPRLARSIVVKTALVAKNHEEERRQETLLLLQMDLTAASQILEQLPPGPSSRREMYQKTIARLQDAVVELSKST
jgi:hypothetical protein